MKSDIASNWSVWKEFYLTTHPYNSEFLVKDLELENETYLDPNDFFFRLNALAKILFTLELPTFALKPFARNRFNFNLDKTNCDLINSALEKFSSSLEEKGKDIATGPSIDGWSIVLKQADGGYLLVRNNVNGEIYDIGFFNNYQLAIVRFCTSVLNEVKIQS